MAICGGFMIEKKTGGMSDEIKKPREWKLTFTTNMSGEEQNPVVTEGPVISGYEAEVRIVEYSALEAAQADIAVLKDAFEFSQGNLRKEFEALKARETELLNLVMEMREGFALMAEGEGSDYKVYMEMSRYYFTKADATLKKLGVTE